MKRQTKEGQGNKKIPSKTKVNLKKEKTNPISAIDFYEKALAYKDAGMFFKNGKARKWRKNDLMIIAKVNIDLAYSINPVCESILFLKGTIYSYFYEEEIAVNCYETILANAKNNSEEVNCRGHQIQTRKSLQNDANFELYRRFNDLGNQKKSQEYLKKYLAGLNKGIDSLYKPLEKFILD